MGTLLSKIKPVIDPKSQEAFDYFRGVDNVIRQQNTSESGVNEAATPPQDRSSTSEENNAVAEHSVSNPSGQLKKVPIGDGKNLGGKTLDNNLTYAITVTATALFKLEG